MTAAMLVRFYKCSLRLRQHIKECKPSKTAQFIYCTRVIQRDGSENIRLCPGGEQIAKEEGDPEEL
jgi:hypothetical protein